MSSRNLKASLVFGALVLLIFGSPAWSQESVSQPDHDLLAAQRSKAYDALATKDYATAISILKSIVDKNPEDARSNWEYGGALFSSASRYYHSENKQPFSSEATPILKEAAVYLDKAAQAFNKDNPRESFFKSQAYYLLGDIQHYGFGSLKQAGEMYRMSLSINPQNTAAQNELELIKKEKE